MSSNPQRAAFMRRLALNGVIGCLFFGALGTGFYHVKQYVDEQVLVPTREPSVVLKNKPRWMSEFLCQKIAETARSPGLHSAFDHDMLVQARIALEANPWVAKVYQVRRAYKDAPGDTLEIDCEYRVPTAVVKAGNYYWLVDRDGYKLPERYEAKDLARVVKVEEGRVDIRVIEGVHAASPPAGQKWPGDDLAAGLEMCRLLADKPYAQNILRINVAHFADPRESHIVLVAKQKTDICWGRTPSELDREPFMEVSTAKKLHRLELIYKQFGRDDVPDQPPIDIRFDNGVTTEASAGPDIRNPNDEIRIKSE